MKKLIIGSLLLAIAATSSIAAPAKTPAYKDIYETAVGHTKEKACYDKITTPMTGHDWTFITTSTILPGFGSFLHPTFWKAMKSLDECGSAMDKGKDYHVMHAKKHYNLTYSEYKARVSSEYSKLLWEKNKKDDAFFK